ncbi:hypothetical protein PVL29_020275 [Vitis rotundifolia]|uniref:KIB1-4 beta-propeller domain-containing protein n=1 Tax=Vitis rotundifolia TaxID=103349 RepID=A0AA38Z2S2_VITRO|nr:hypothetical protein PVL29_020275 [Vitis rotundifolia]
MALPSSSDWASLSINLLDSILDYLVPMEDYLTFGEVCIKWQYAVCEKLQHLRSNHKRHCRLHQPVPLLMAPTADNPRRRCCLYDVMKGKSLWEVELRQGRWSYEGSPHGWLVLVDDNSYKVTLHSPFSGKLIHLPPLEKSIFLEHSGSVHRTIFPYKPRRVCKDWTYIKDMRDLKDIVYSNGLFYVLDGWGVLYSCDVSNDSKVRRITAPDNHCAHLLRVIKHEGGFVIYKLQWFSKNPTWEEVKSLDDVSLFLGDNHSISVIASDFAGCQPNSIYFCQRCSFSKALDGSIYVFSLNDRTVTLLYPRSPRPLLWISPKFA